MLVGAAIVGIELNHLCNRGVFGVTLITRRLVALASAWASALVSWITRFPLRFNIAPVVSWATPNFLPTLTTFAITPSKIVLLFILYNMDPNLRDLASRGAQ